ncbi:Hypothetical protein D9617_15g042920 [Elsinoe fawcettii]|nr:Hypothetical protein D9617_15g042920 [Elsinoe fawcettii]
MASDRSRADDKHRRSRRRSAERAEGHSHKRRKTDDIVNRLPHDAKHLTKHDLPEYRALFGTYLDLQKQLNIEDLDEQEIKGRWKSFIGKWNRGELRGYYDPAVKSRADDASHGHNNGFRSPGKSKLNHNDARPDEDEDDDGYGPALPKQSDRGAALPTSQDLQYRDELNAETRRSDREADRFERKAERKQQRERMDEVMPRAEPGTRERQLEKKREQGDANRSFREGREGGAEEVGDRDLMGEDGYEGLKAQIKEQERKKSERELRKEEVLRAQEAEREERLSAHRAKEAKTMDMFKEIARQRFG